MNHMKRRTNREKKERFNLFRKLRRRVIGMPHAILDRWYAVMLRRKAVQQ